MNATDHGIVACSYLVITAPDVSAWERFATDGLGMERTPDSTADRLRLRLDERSWRFCVEPGPRGVSGIGWEVRSAAALADLEERLRVAGSKVDRRPDLAEAREVDELVVVEDPAGRVHELFRGAPAAAAPFVSPTGTRFVTGERMPGDLGFGHVVVAYQDVGRAADFFLDVLGFRLSDKAREPTGDLWWFAHVNPRHHSLAFGPGPVDGELHHVMLEVESIDQVGAALDRMTAMGVHVSAGLGRHTNDRMFSFYARTPGGFEIEYGHGGLTIDDSGWSPVVHDGASVWGHRPDPAPAPAHE